MAIPVLYRDNMILVCEKPNGVSSERPGLPDVVEKQISQRVFPVHRLDAGTGGVILLACSAETCSEMQKFFHQGLVYKEYLAVVSGTLEESSGTMEDLLYHDPVKNKTYIVHRERKGVRKAVCKWFLCSSASLNGQELSLVRVVLYSGRTHQIRVQFGSRGFPLVGDRKYGSRIKAGTHALWASALSFPHPVTKEQISVSSSPPPVFPWTLFHSF